MAGKDGSKLGHVPAIDVRGFDQAQAKADAQSAGITQKIHAHHIVMKEGPEAVRNDAVAGKALEMSQDLLAAVKIDLKYGWQNLAWAPNRGHSKDYAKHTWAKLKDIPKPRTQTEVTNTLREIAGDFFYGRIRTTFPQDLLND